MLVLSRRKRQSISIGEAGTVLDGPVTVTVTEIRGDKVQLGIEAPREVPVHRCEVIARILAEIQKRPTADELRAAAGV